MAIVQRRSGVRVHVEGALEAAQPGQAGAVLADALQAAAVARQHPGHPQRHRLVGLDLHDQPTRGHESVARHARAEPVLGAARASALTGEGLDELFMYLTSNIGI